MCRSNIMVSTFIEAAAGAGKTTHIVEQAINRPSKHVLITTYTIENASRIRAVVEKCGELKSESVTIQPWYTFLLSHGVKPYLGMCGFDAPMPCGVNMPQGRSTRGVRKNSLEYYFDSANRIYTDKLAELTLLCNEKSGGLVMQRLSRLFDCIFLDEAQDISGADLDFVAELGRSISELILAGDPRQVTYSTNQSQRNSQYRHSGFVQYVDDKGLSEQWLIDDSTLCDSYRCSQEILDCANRLFPEYPLAKSRRPHSESDNAPEGVLVVRSADAFSYFEKVHPVVLRDSTRSEVPAGFQAKNIGLVKGATFDHVLVFPTGTMLSWLKKNSFDLAFGTRCRLYVALTRARLSVAFVVPDGDIEAYSNYRMWSEES